MYTGGHIKGFAVTCASNFIAPCIHQLYGQGLLACNSICIRYNTELLTGQVVNVQLIAGQVEPFFGITCSVLHLAARKVEFCLCGIGIALIGSDRKDITALASLDSVIGGAADGNSGRYGVTHRKAYICSIGDASGVTIGFYANRQLVGTGSGRSELEVLRTALQTNIQSIAGYFFPAAICFLMVQGLMIGKFKGQVTVPSIIFGVNGNGKLLLVSFY